MELQKSKLENQTISEGEKNSGQIASEIRGVSNNLNVSDSLKDAVAEKRVEIEDICTFEDICSGPGYSDGSPALGLRKVTDPKLPNQMEVDAHQLTHVPYRNWWPHCVKGRGKEMGH